VGDTTTYSELSGIKTRDMSGTQKDLRFATAFLAFVLIFQLIARSNMVHIDPLAGTRRTWTTWALHDFLRVNEGAPDVVFLGSSLMLTPINMADAQALHTTFDGALHHESNWFEAVVKDKTGSDINTFNFALPGEMPSDAFLIEKDVLKAEKTPKVIIYGVGPRDFMDNLLASPSSTDPYHWLAKLDSSDSEWEFCGQDWYQKLNCAIANAFMPNRLRLQLAEDVTARTATLVDAIVPAPPGGYVFTPQQKHEMMPGFHSMDVVLGECLFEPRVDIHAGRFVNNLDEYRGRYAHPDWDKFQTQLTFLAKALNLANQRHIQFVLVAMPITDVNRGLISDQAWGAYKNGLGALARSKNVVYLDLNKSTDFTEFDFGDTVHLNALGGIKIVKQLAELTVADPRLSEALGLKRNKPKFVTKGVAVL
jgi:hypothetical protein